MLDLCKLKSVMDTYSIFSSFSGFLSQGIIEEIGDALQRHVSSGNCNTPISRSLFPVFIEQSQNILNYFAEKREEGFNDEEMYNSAIIVIGKNDESYFSTAGNYVLKEDVQKIKIKIESVKDKTKEELKKMYKEQLKKEADPNRRGAGLGFIDMSRKSKKPIEYDFVNINEKYDFFAYTVFVE